MLNNSLIFFSLIIAALGLSLMFFYLRRASTYKQLFLVQEEKFQKQQQEMSRKVYELAILKELGERVGYSLNIEKIIDIITGSLGQFIEYSAVSYMLLEQEKIIFKIHLEQSVSRPFVDEVKERMLRSLSALLDKEFKVNQVTETLTGAILIEDLETPVRSYFNIPLVIREKVVGVLTVANTKSGLYQEEEMTILYKITKQASQAVNKLQEVVEMEQGKLEAMVESITDGIVMTDLDYRVMIANPAARQAIGLPLAQEISIFNFIDSLGGKFDIRGRLEESVKLNKVIKSAEVLLGEKFYKIYVAPVKSESVLLRGEILGGVVIFHDITPEKEVEKLREDFTSMMVHELRSPLDGIKKISKLLSEDYIRKDKKSYNEFISLINKDSGKMLELVNDLLDVAKLESGKFQINPQTVDIRELIHERQSFFKPIAEENEIELTVNFTEDFPTKIEIDPLRISQILNNLINNSLKFTDTSGKIEIQGFIHHLNKKLNDEAKDLGLKWFNVSDRYNLQKFPDALVVAITDNGIGIAENNQQMLFNKFVQFQASARGGEKKGTGLGLVIVKGIIESHQGKIGVGSQEIGRAHV